MLLNWSLGLNVRCCKGTLSILKGSRGSLGKERALIQNIQRKKKSCSKPREEGLRLLLSKIDSLADSPTYYIGLGSTPGVQGLIE